ncbi:methionyl-tRNA formyltransferase domain protein [Mycobacterium xenopi 3993]|nr:methionyl-tRNA formyltransferase domain protein [Mycobacterium xenopi 3993]
MTQSPVRRPSASSRAWTRGRSTASSPRRFAHRHRGRFA